MGGGRDNRPELRRRAEAHHPSAGHQGGGASAVEHVDLTGEDNSLASTILVTELLRQAQIIAAPTFEFFALYGTAAVYYWVICLVLSFGQGRIERRLERYVAR